MSRPQRIACLAWGSLIWKAGPLGVASEWHPGGPPLPIEFCRVGDGGELATAIWPGAARVPTRWALLEATTLAPAREQLRRREEIDAANAGGVGDAPAGDPSLPCAGEIAAWAEAHRFDHVVWTALPPRHAGIEGRAPTVDEAVAYLEGLEGDVREHAEHYIRSVPAEIETTYRAAFAERLGWTARTAR